VESVIANGGSFLLEQSKKFQKYTEQVENQAQRREALVILCSSKTLDEQQHLSL
jgi:hypothetical protein